MNRCWLLKKWNKIELSKVIESGLKEVSISISPYRETKHKGPEKRSSRCSQVGILCELVTPLSQILVRTCDNFWLHRSLCSISTHTEVGEGFASFGLPPQVNKSWSRCCFLLILKGTHARLNWTFTCEATHRKSVLASLYFQTCADFRQLLVWS